MCLVDATIQSGRLSTSMANILVIDEDLILLNLIATTLRLEGHTVNALSDPPAVLDSLQGGGMSLDLLVTEINLVGLSGFELVRRLCKAGFTRAIRN